MIEIRKMQKSDVPEVYEIEKEAFSIPWSENAFLESLELPHAMFLVAEYKGEIAGYVGMYHVFQEGDITNIAVKSSARGNGIAHALLEELQKQAIESGILDLTLEVRESNERAIHIYEKFGFKNVGIRKNFYEKPRENAIIMWKREINK